MTLADMRDADTNEAVTSAPHPQQHLLIRMPQPVSSGAMLRRAKTAQV